MSVDNRDDLEGLAIALANAKKLEDEARKARLEAEEKLASAIGGRDVGSTSVNCGGIKVTVKRGYSYKADDLAALAKAFPELVRTRSEVHASAYERLRNEDEKAFAEASKFVTATPRKAAVELKL